MMKLQVSIQLNRRAIYFQNGLPFPFEDGLKAAQQGV
jgi:hypothetical protein